MDQRTFISEVQRLIGVEDDGFFGVNTGRAWTAWKEKHPELFGTPDDKPIYNGGEVILGVPHACQGDYPKVMICGKTEDKPVSRIGCASCVVAIHRAFYSPIEGTPADVPGTVQALNDADGYTDDRDIRWDVVEQQFGLKHTRDISRSDALSYFADAIPVIIVERTQYGGTHFTVAVAREDGRWGCVNPGRKGGDFYNNVDADYCWKSDDQVVRIDVLQPV